MTRAGNGRGSASAICHAAGAILPKQFDPVTNRTIELIDVLWLDGNSIEAAFEIESTTSIYSGILRMSDLLAQQPNISSYRFSSSRLMSEETR